MRLVSFAAADRISLGALLEEGILDLARGSTVLEEGPEALSGEMRSFLEGGERAWRAFDYIAGYTLLNDSSARDLQFAEKQWTRAKSLDTFCPMGPALVSKNENTRINQRQKGGGKEFDYCLLLC